MATPVKDILKAKKYPKWFSSHPIFKEVKEIKKVFPAVGLPNFEHEVAIDNSPAIIEAANWLIGDIKRELSYRGEHLIGSNKKAKINPEVKAKLDNCSALLLGVYNLLKIKKNVVQNANNRISLKLPDNVSIDNKPIFRKNESLFRVYNKLAELVLETGVKIPLQTLEGFASFKAFSSENIPANKMKIVFSSDGVNGAWDIATMSSRGIRSCQSWEGGEYKHCTIGSVIDPFVAIMYMTSGVQDTSGYGSKMMRRCIVRFVIDGSKNKPFLLLDQMYPQPDKAVLDQFKKLLQEKTDGKFDVVHSAGMKPELAKHSYLPTNSVRKTLKQTSVNGKKKFHEGHDGDYYETIQSYQDYKIKDKAGKKFDKQSELFEKNSSKKARKFREAFAKSFAETVKKLEVKSLPKTIQSAVKTSAKGNYGSGYHIFYNTAIDIANQIVESVDKSQFTNSDTYIRRVFYQYFNSKKKVIDAMKNQSIKTLNGGMHLKTGKRFGIRTFVSMMDLVYPEVDKAMKEELKKVVEKRNAKEIEPLPLPV